MTETTQAGSTAYSYTRLTSWRYDGEWFREPFLDSRNWFPDASDSTRLLLPERVLRELSAEGLIILKHSATGVVVPSEEYSRLFAGPGWRRGEPDPDFGDAEYVQTDAGAERTAQ